MGAACSTGVVGGAWPGSARFPLSLPSVLLGGLQYPLGAGVSSPWHLPVLSHQLLLVAVWFLTKFPRVW